MQSDTRFNFRTMFDKGSAKAGNITFILHHGYRKNELEIVFSQLRSHHRHHGRAPGEDILYSIHAVENENDYIRQSAIYNYTQNTLVRNAVFIHREYQTFSETIKQYFYNTPTLDLKEGDYNRRLYDNTEDTISDSL